MILEMINVCKVHTLVLSGNHVQLVGMMLVEFTTIRNQMNTLLYIYILLLLFTIAVVRARLTIKYKTSS